MTNSTVQFIITQVQQHLLREAHLGLKNEQIRTIQQFERGHFTFHKCSHWVDTVLVISAAHQGWERKTVALYKEQHFWKRAKCFQFFSLRSRDSTVHSGSTYLYSYQLVEYFSGDDTSQSARQILRKKMGREFSDQINFLSSAGSWDSLLFCHAFTVLSFFHSNTPPHLSLKFSLLASMPGPSLLSHFTEGVVWLPCGCGCLLKYFHLCPMS